MFLKSIHIKNYNQFENLELDLTYPKGHAKEGEPLEKICIIGDNGTGKTTILELIRDYYEFLSRFHSVEGVQNILKRMPEKYPDANGEALFRNSHDPITGKLRQDTKVLFFPTGPDLSKLHSDSDSIFINKIQTIKSTKSLKPNVKTAYQNSPSSAAKTAFGGKTGAFSGGSSHQSSQAKEPIVQYHLDRFIYDFNDEEVLNIWNHFKNTIQPTIETELSYRLESLKGIKNQNDLAETRAVLDKIETFKNENPNGLDQLANFLNPLLNKFHLELNTNINLEKFNEINFLDLKAKDGTIVPIQQWSTGIRQLIYTALPLYTLKPQKGIIIIDEAERSLYPNTQRILIDFYKSICPNMQLIFATHSPILASSFEPWEVIELRFNNEGKVERKLYYEGEENHVDNYRVHPMYLTWNSLFMDMFGVKGESNDARTKKLVELAILDREVKLTDDKAKKKELFKKYEKIAEQLDWGSL